MVDSLQEKRKTDPHALRDISVSGEDMSTEGSFPTDFDTFQGQLEEAKNPYETEQEYSNEFLSETVPLTNPVFSNTEAALRLAALSTDPVNAYSTGMSLGSLGTHQQILNQGRSHANQLLASVVEEMALEGEEIDPEVIALMQEENEYLVETGPERAWAEQLEGYWDLDEDGRENLIMSRWTQRQIAQLIDDYGIIDGITDIAGIFLVPDETYNTVDFVNKVMGTETDVESVLNSADALTQLGNAYKRLDPKEQIAMFNLMKEAATDVDDNTLQQIFLLMGATGEVTLGEERFSQSMDKLTAAGWVGKFISTASRGTRILKDLAKIKETDKVAVLADTAARGTRGPREVQTSQIDGASSVMPSTTGLENILEQAPTGVASAVRDQWAKMDAVQREALNFIQEGVPLTDADIARVIERETARLMEQPNLENLSTKVLPDGVEFTFDVMQKNPTTGLIEGTLGENKVVKFTQQDITDGFVNQDRVTLMGDVLSGVYSPNKLFGGERANLVQAFERIANAQAKVKSKLTDSLRLATKGLNKKQLGNVERVLFEGSVHQNPDGTSGRLYSYHDLVVQGIGGIKLSDKEFQAYAATRKVIDDMWVLKNQELREAMEVRGAKLVQAGPGQEGYASVMEDAVSAMRKYEAEAKFKNIYFPEKGTNLSKDAISPEYLSELYDQGYVLTKLDSTSDFWKAASDTSTKWAIVRRENISDLPDTVLNYLSGYVPRIYDDAYYFVKTAEEVVEGNRVFKTQRYFDNITDAEKFKSQLMKEAGEGADPDNFQVVFNREPVGNTDLDSDVINMFGGLFSSPRKQEALKFGLEGQDAKLVEPLEALQQYMFHLGNRMPMAKYRLGMQQKWMNAARRFLGRPVQGDFNSILREVEESINLDSKQRKFLMKSHEQIDTLSHIPTRDEQLLQGKFVAIGNSLEAKSPALKGAAKFMYSLNQTNPVNAVKAATHHALLGVYSMAQFPVQALGATIAFSINPKYAAKGSSKWLAFSYLDNITDPAVRALAIKKLSKAEGLNLGDLEEAYGLWSRSGYRDSVLVTNGDYASIANGLPYDGNLVKRLFDKGTFFFKAGELANMRISFATSLERWRDLNPGKALDDAALKEIFARSEQFRLNMGQGNRARFQKGAISIPLQFQQINTKFFEAISAGSAFSREERMRLMVGQGALFGAVGIPLGQQAYSYLVDAADIDTSEMSAEELNLLKRGVVGWAVNNLAGIDAEVSGRVAIAGGLTDMMTEMIFEKHSLLGLAGPTGSVTERFWNGPLDVVMNANKQVVTADGLGADDVGLIAENLLWSTLEIPSGPRNIIIAADLAQTGLVRTTNGNILWASDPDYKDLVFQAMGFQSVEKQEFYDLMLGERSRKEAEKALVDRLSRMYVRLLRTTRDNDMEGADAAAKTIAILGNYIEDEATQSRVSKALINRFKADDELSRLLESTLKASNDFSSPATNTLNLLRQEAITGER